MRQTKQTIGILGFGVMGKAIFSALRKDKRYTFAVHSLDVKKISGAAVCDSLSELYETSDVIFLCVKPQDFYELPRADFSKKNITLISVMAGVPLKAIHAVFPFAKMVRTMPNLALQVGQAVVGWYVPIRVFSARELEDIEVMLANFGLAVRMKKEQMLDVITAVSGSGPAYVFVFAGALAKAAQSLGFTYQQANLIVSQTIKGAMTYAQQDGRPWDALTQSVVSKKGTTAAALQKLNVKKFERQWQAAVKSAYRRAQELSRHD